MWINEYSGTCQASPEQVFSLLGNPRSWPEWNPGVARIEMPGPFAEGAEAIMVFPDGTELPFTIIWVEANRGYADETAVPDSEVVIRVWHKLEPLEGGTRITYRVEADGPEDVAAAIGAEVSADFPDVIAALAQQAEQGS